MIQILTTLGIDHVVIEGLENAPSDIAAVERAIETNPGVDMVAVVHCETTTGIINPIDKIGAAVKAAGKTFFVDAMSSFGAIPIDFNACNIDYLVSSANKCIEGVPGFAFAIARKDALLAVEGNARSVSLDLLAQWRGLEKNGQFRFTPPTHALLAFHQALHELEAEGGVNGRAARYGRNYEVLVEGMRALGFREYLEPDLQGYIITSFRYPDDPNFDFERFYTLLSDRGFVIYPGKVSDADCFRIGHIGRIFESDSRALVNAIREVLEAMKVTIGKDG